MASPPPPELLDDNLKLEPKVVLALSRLSRSQKTGRWTGVSCKQIVQYLSASYSSLDGDVESQVLTALLSCVRTGVVCALDNGKYALAGPGAKGVVSLCLGRGPHGPRCCCLATLKCTSRTLQRSCCVLKASPASTRKGKRTSGRLRADRRRGRTKSSSKSRARRCAQEAHQLLEAKDSCGVQFDSELATKCRYCLEIHPAQGPTPRLCRTCHPDGGALVVPFDTFSPREELM